MTATAEFSSPPLFFNPCFPRFNSPWSLHLSDQLPFVSTPAAMFGVKRQRDDEKSSELDPQNKVRSCSCSRRVLAQKLEQ